MIDSEVSDRLADLCCDVSRRSATKLLALPAGTLVLAD